MSFWCISRDKHCSIPHILSLPFNPLLLGTVKLRHIPRPKFTVCILGDQQHCDEATGESIDFDPFSVEMITSELNLSTILCVLAIRILHGLSANGIPSMDQESLKKMNKNKKLVKKLAKKYNAFLASDTLIKQVH